MANSAPAGIQMTLKDWLIMALLSIMWGASFFSTEIALTELPPFTIVLTRVGLAAVTLFFYLRLRGIPLPFEGRSDKAQIIFAMALMGFFNNIVPQSLIVWGQTHITSSLASILNATMPIFTVFIAHFFTSDEKLSANRLIGVLMGFGGVVLIVGPAALQGLTSGLLGQAAVLGGACSYAVAAVIGRRFVRLGLRPMQIAFGQVLAATVMFTPFVLVYEKAYMLPMPSGGVIVALISLATVSTAFAYLLYFRLIANTGATNASLVTLTIPVTASALGIGFLGEVFEPTHGLGLVCIGLGLLIIDGRIFRRRARPDASGTA